MLVLDREGDHRTLAERRGILGVDGKDPLPNAHQLSPLSRHRSGSVVVDLSQRSQQEQHDHVVSVTPAILAQRAVTGLPHGVFLDEVHTLPVGEGRWADALSAGDKGFCLSPYMPGPPPRIRASQRRGARVVARWRTATALLIAAAAPVPPEPFTDSDRVSGNRREVHRHLAACGDGSLAAHARHHDVSRWIHDVLQDTDVAESVTAAERQQRTGHISTRRIECRCRDVAGLRSRQDAHLGGHLERPERGHPDHPGSLTGSSRRLGPDDADRTLRMRRALLTDRSEQQAAEAAAPS